MNYLYKSLHRFPICFEETKQNKTSKCKVKRLKCHCLHFIKFDGIKVPNLGIGILDLCERLNLACWFSSLVCKSSSTFELVVFASPSE